MASIFARAVQDNDGHFVGLAHFRATLATPAMRTTLLQI